MGDIGKFNEESLIIGVLASAGVDAGALKAELEAEFGPAEFASPEIMFDYTDYYNGEMGQAIRRWFYSFERTVAPDELARIKILTNELELNHAVDGMRKVNYDPGLLDLNRLILATTKNVGHRIPLSGGIYGEVTLMYMKGDFHPLPWTYPDYRSDDYRTIMKELRSIYKEKLKQQKKAGV